MSSRAGNVNRPSGPVEVLGKSQLRSKSARLYRDAVPLRGDRDLRTRSRLAVGEEDQAGVSLGGMECEVEGLRTLIRSEGPRHGRFVTRSVDSDERAARASSNATVNLTARDLDGQVLGPIDVVP